MNDVNASAERMRGYVADLGARLQARQEWTERHPDHKSPQFTADEDTYFKFQAIGHTAPPATSTFDPNDPTPNTSDLLSAQIFFDVAYIAITALDKATGVHNE